MKLLCTTPSKVNSEILQLCEKVLPGSKPVFVQVNPSPDAVVNECFYNVENHVSKNGGRSVIGWQLWEWPGVFAEAEFHAVWQRPDGILEDITPKVDGEATTLFVIDPTRTFEGVRVGNIKHAIAKNEIVKDYIALLDLKFAFHEKQQAGKVVSIMPYHGEMLEKSLVVVKEMLKKGRTLTGKCVCRSGSVYRDCHRHEVKDAIDQLTKLARLGQ